MIGTMESALKPLLLDFIQGNITFVGMIGTMESALKRKPLPQVCCNSLLE